MSAAGSLVIACYSLLCFNLQQQAWLSWPLSASPAAAVRKTQQMWHMPASGPVGASMQQRSHLLAPGALLTDY